MMNNVDNKNDNNNDDTVWNVFIGLFSVVIFIGIVYFCVTFILNLLKAKNYLKINIFTTLIKMVIKSLKIKNQSYYY